MGNSLFGTALSGLNVAQRGLATVGHNIANVDTPGYSRQRVDQVARVPQFTGAGYVGQGAQIAGVERVYDSFVNSQIRTSQATASRLDTLHDLSSGVDRLLGDPSGSLAPAMQEFFGAVQDATVDPSSIAARQALLSGAEGLVERMIALDQRLETQTRTLEQRMESVIGEVNVIAANVAEMNQRIVEAEGRAGGKPANDLRDQRDELIRQLAERIDIQATEQRNGIVNVSVAKGQLLVAGSTAGTLSLTDGAYDPSRRDVGLTAAGNTVIISEQIAGGELGGMLQFRGQVLEPARNAVGRIAVGITEDVNTLHRLGQDLEDQPGGDLFRPLAASAASVFSHSGNTSATPATLEVGINDSASLTTSDYVLSLNGTSYDLLRLSDGATTTLAAFPGGIAEVDGMRLQITAGAMADGDSFLIAPTRFAIGEMDVAVTDPRDLALAAPVRTVTGAANIGTASISEATVNSPDNSLAVTFNTPSTTFDVVDTTTGATLAAGVSYVTGATHTYNGVSFTLSDGATLPAAPAAGDRFDIVRGVAQPDTGNAGNAGISATTVSAPDANLTDPVTITFDNPATSFTVTGATTGTPVTTVPYTPGDPISFNGWTVNIVGTPAPGDSFQVVRNVGGVGDNRNGLAIASLQERATLDGLTASYGEAYGQTVSRVGARTAQAESARDAQFAVMDQLNEARASTSGVNLDEEAANLLRYQESYQASAQMIRAADELFQTLLGVVAG